jgi:tRNA threonylcarbamoyl adenosine modification protein (Sua5/YciO/YrdC/YwlC family)
MFVRIHPINPEERKISQVVDCLKNGGLIIYPTDTVYGIGCDIFNPKAIEKLYRIKGVNEKTAQFSFICKDISDFSKYTKSIDTPVFKILKKCLPGAYTFILPASKEVPKLLKTKKNTVGLRIPDNTICQAIVHQLGNPIISTSLPETFAIEDSTDPETFYYLFENKVDMVIDGGIGNMLASTVVSFDEDGTAQLIRTGAGDVSIFED